MNFPKKIFEKKFKMAIFWVSAILAVFGFAHHHFAQFFDKCVQKYQIFSFVSIFNPRTWLKIKFSFKCKKCEKFSKIKQTSGSLRSCDAPICKLSQNVYYKKILVFYIFLIFQPWQQAGVLCLIYESSYIKICNSDIELL